MRSQRQQFCWVGRYFYHEKMLQKLTPCSQKCLSRGGTEVLTIHLQNIVCAIKLERLDPGLSFEILFTKMMRNIAFIVLGD